MKNKNNIVIGAVFVALGLIFILDNFNILRFSFNIFDLTFLISHFWPALFLIFPGFLMHLTFFSGKNRDAGILVPGGILLVVGLTCQVSMLTGDWSKTWPGYILSVAVGLFELYLFGNREKGLLIPVAILGTMSLIFFENLTFRWFFDLKLKNLIVSAVLIILGLSIIFRSSLPGRSNNTNSNGGESQNNRQTSETKTGSENGDGQNS